jgi:hypothetical protein
MNVDMDEPMEHRRDAIERLREAHGALCRSDEAPASDTPFHAAWWLEGEPGRGRVKVEITLDPQPFPRVQYLELTSVPEPDARLRATAEILVSSANGTAAELPPLAESSIAPRSNGTSSWYGRCSVGTSRRSGRRRRSNMTFGRCPTRNVGPRRVDRRHGPAPQRHVDSASRHPSRFDVR